MKYREITIKESDILDGRGVHEVARLVGCDPAFISRLKNNKQIANYEFYQKLIKVLTE